MKWSSNVRGGWFKGMAAERIVHEHLLAWSVHRTLGACLCYRFCGWKPPCFLVVGFGNGKTCAVPGVGFVGFRVYRIEETKADWAICRLPSTTMIHVSGTFSDRLLLFFSMEPFKKSFSVLF